MAYHRGDRHRGLHKARFANLRSGRLSLSGLPRSRHSRPGERQRSGTHGSARDGRAWGSAPAPQRHWWSSPGSGQLVEHGLVSIASNLPFLGGRDSVRHLHRSRPPFRTDLSSRTGSRKRQKESDCADRIDSCQRKRSDRFLWHGLILVGRGPRMSRQPRPCLNTELNP